jgi:hypothetical protein
MADAELKVRIDAETRDLQKGLNTANQKLGTFASKANNSLGGFAKNTSALMGTVAASIAGAFSVGAIIGFTKQVFNATAQFQKFEAVLGNTLGSSALAGLKLKEIQEFAAKTPFGVNELTASFVKLANSGFKPTGDEMRRLGDLASSTGKSFDQLSEAILDAQTGEFERLKEFGVRAQDAGNKVIFTFKGVQTQVDKSSSAIREYITSLGDAEGVSGSMAVISETLGGKISNLGDSWDQMLVSVGGNTSGIFSSVISIVSRAVDAITEFNNRLDLTSKFKLKTDFGLNFQQGSLKLSDVKNEVLTVENAQKSVQKYIKSIQEIAKTPEEFKSAIKALIELNREQVTGLNNNNVAKAITAQFQQGVNTLNALAVEAAKIVPKDAGFGKSKKDKEEKEIFARGSKISIQRLNSLDSFLEKYRKTESEINKIPLIGFPPDTAQRLIEPVQSFGDYLRGDILPQLGSSFKTFFDEILIRGNLSFAALGKSIISTFASVLANQATTGVLALLGDKDAQAKGNIFSKALTAIGGKGGETGGIAGILGKVLPIAGIAIAGASILGGIFKKKTPPPQPAYSTSTVGTSSASSVDFGSGRVVFEIQGSNLIGVLNRAGAKLQRYTGP